MIPRYIIHWDDSGFWQVLDRTCGGSVVASFPATDQDDAGAFIAARRDVERRMYGRTMTAFD